MTRGIDISPVPVNVAQVAGIGTGQRYVVELVVDSSAESARFVEAESVDPADLPSAFHTLAPGAPREFLVRESRPTDTLWIWLPSGAGRLAVTEGFPEGEGETQ